MTNRNLRKSPVPEWVHGKWVQVYLDRDPLDRDHGYARVAENNGIPGVAVIPVSGDLVGMVRLYRPPISRVIQEIPRGMSDSGDLRTEAARELREETGLVVPPSSLVDLGSVFPNGGLLATELRLFAAVIDPVDQHSAPEDEDEIDQFLWVPAGELMSVIKDSGLVEECERDAFTEVALLRALLHGLLPLASFTSVGR